MAQQAVKVRREALSPCMTCPICRKLLRDATTIVECLHTFCRKCIYKKVSDEEMEFCPVCNIYLGCVPLEKLSRPDHNLQVVRAKIFPYKRIKVKAPEILSPVTLPAKRKERSLSSLVVSTPRVSAQSGMTGRRSKSIARKASRGSSFSIEKPVKKYDFMEDYPESSSSPDTMCKLSQNMRQNSGPNDLSHNPSSDKARENGSAAWEGKSDIWKPLTCLVEAANRSKCLKVETQGSVAKSSAIHSHNSDGILSRAKNKEHRQKSKVHDENYDDYISPKSEKPKKVRKIREKKAQNFGECMIPPQAVIDIVGTKFDRRNYPIWFSLVADDEQEGNASALPQIPASYLRIKDGSISVSFIHKYLKKKLNLTNEEEIEIKCMGQAIIPTTTLNNLVDLWLLHSAATDRVTATIGSSAKDFVMVLGYARKVPSDS